MSQEEELEQLKRELEARMREILRQNPNSRQLKDILGIEEIYAEEDEPRPEPRR